MHITPYTTTPHSHLISCAFVVQTMLMTTEELIHKLEKAAETPDKPVEMNRHFVLLALDTVCRCAFRYGHLHTCTEN